MYVFKKAYPYTVLLMWKISFKFLTVTVNAIEKHTSLKGTNRDQSRFLFKGIF